MLSGSSHNMLLIKLSIVNSLPRLPSPLSYFEEMDLESFQTTSETYVGLNQTLLNGIG